MFHCYFYSLYSSLISMCLVNIFQNITTILPDVLGGVTLNAYDTSFKAILDLEANSRLTCI